MVDRNFKVVIEKEQSQPAKSPKIIRVCDLQNLDCGPFRPLNYRSTSPPIQSPTFDKYEVSSAITLYLEIVTDNGSSKISVANVRQNIKDLLAGSEEKKRNFTETIELQIGLKNYDPQRYAIIHSFSDV